MPTDASLVQILIQGGLTGVCLLLIWTGKDDRKSSRDTIDRNTSALIEHSKTNVQLSESIHSLKETVQDKL